MSTVEIQVSGPEESMKDSRTLAMGETLRVGRKPASGWPIPWERQMSREHADVHWDGRALRFSCLAAARNPVFYRHRPEREFTASIGDEFGIGQTKFCVVRSTAVAQDVAAMTMVADGVLETIFSAEQLSHVSFGNTDRQMEQLAALPSMIAASTSDDELAAKLAALLLEVIPQAAGSAVVRLDPNELDAVAEAQSEELPEAALATVETRGHAAGGFRPSRRLTLKTLKERQSIIHIWQSGEGSEKFTMTEGLDWAFCAPVPGDSCRGWCLYVSGKGIPSGAAVVSSQDLQGDLRFTELVAQFIGSVRQVRLLQAHKTQLSTFFSPNVINSVTGALAGERLKPAVREITVLFCDVRGFSRKAEQMSHDLLRLLRSVSEVLGVMANGILGRDGTIADFQGDAALGFWGWPVELADGPIPACRAALEISRNFSVAASSEASLLAGFDVGIGIAHGLAIAGQVGTEAQAKVGVFGPIVNLGARFEGLTRQLGVPICIDQTTAEWVNRNMPSSEAQTRRLARVSPKGMREALTVYALLPSEPQAGELNRDSAEVFDRALDAVIEGRWDVAQNLLTQLHEDDGPTQFLLRQMEIAGNIVPKDWDGTFVLTTK